MVQRFWKNIIHHNNFIENTKQAYDPAWEYPHQNPSVNLWDDSTEGNYWSDYNGTDADGDGIGDTPYIVGEDNIDRYSLMNPVAIPEFPDEETPPDNPIEWTSLHTTLLVAAVLIVLATTLGTAIYRRKKRAFSKTL